jgi:hypothetical protein
MWRRKKLVGLGYAVMVELQERIERPVVVLVSRNRREKKHRAHIAMSEEAGVARSHWVHNWSTASRSRIHG